jgi:hypothetical protein
MSKDFDIHEWRLYQANLNLLNEEEEEWDLEAGPEWNEKELKVGDYWYDSSVPGWTGVWSDYKDVPNILKNSVIKITYIGPYKPELNKSHYRGKNVVAMERGDEKHVLQLDYFNNEYGPKLHAYIPTNNLNEEEEDWDFEAGDEWNVKELSIGDYITPEMWNNTIYSQAWKALSQDIKIVGFEKGVSLPKWFVIEYIGSSGKIRQDKVNIESFNFRFLKPGYKVTPPNKLNEEDEDEFSQEFIAGPEWNVKELNVGDVVTPEMWDQEKIKNASIINDPYWFEKPHKITKFRPTYLDFVIFDNKRELSLRFVTNFLKPNFKINFNGLNEQDEDEWDLEAGPEWNEKELKVGDYWYDSSVPEWNGVWSNYYDIPDRISDLVLKVIYIGPHKEEFSKPPYNDIPNYYGEYVIISKRNGKFWAFTVDYFNNNFGKRLNAYVPNDNLNESDDEWDLEAGPEWNVRELTTGDVVTPEMWNKNLDQSYGDINDWIDNPAEDQVIDDIYNEEYLTVVVFTGQESNIQNAYSLEGFNGLLDPKYQVIQSLNEQEDDEWDFEAGEEWNTKELTTGDIITSDMVDSNKNNNWFYERDTLIKKMNFQRDAIDPEYLVFLVNLDRYGNEIPGTGRSEWIGIINNSLIPSYKVVPPM